MDKFNKDISNVSKWTLEELRKEEKERKKDAFFWAIFLGLFIGVGIYALIQNGKWLYILAAIFFLTINTKRMTNLRKIRKEIKRRGEK